MMAVKCRDMGLTELPLQVVAGRTLPGRIAARLHELIVDGTYPSGSRLPSPAELATEFGVTTAVIGEAVALLVSAGLVSDRAGKAVVVGRMETRAPSRITRKPWTALKRASSTLLLDAAAVVI